MKCEICHELHSHKTHCQNLWTDKLCIELYEYVYDGGNTPQILYEHYMNDMPYGTAKARTGDPDNWLSDHIEEIEEEFQNEIERGAILVSKKE